ncbi:hypothetical protein FRB90_010807 [Tulasnella sp. 427]|nr:hypothetical protein FRB90_010807 [Tulasnella sp. 427]
MDSTPLLPLLQHNALSGLGDIRICANLSPDLLHRLLRTVGSEMVALKRLKITTPEADIAGSVELDESSDELFDTLVEALGTCPELTGLTLITYFHLDITRRAARRIGSNLTALKHLSVLCLFRTSDEQQNFSALEALAEYSPNIQDLELHLVIPPLGSIERIGSYLPSFTFHKAIHLSASFTLVYWNVDHFQRELDLDHWEIWEDRIWDYISMLLPRGSSISPLQRCFLEVWDDEELGTSLSERLVTRDNMEAVSST